MRSVQKLAKRLLSISRYSTIVLIAFFVSALAVYTYTRVRGESGKVYAATSSTLNFQGRLYTSAGKVVPDGYYNLEFKLYDGGTQGGPAGTGQANAGSLLWTEDWYDSNGLTAGNDNRVRVVNGYFSVTLGAQTAFPGTINWEQELWLTMNVGGTTQTASPTYDGEMLQMGNTRTKLTAVPYSFKSGSARQLIDEQLNGTGNLVFDTLTSNQTITLPDATGKVLLDSTGFSNGGNSFGGLASLGTNDSNGLVLETGGTEKLRIDTSGNVSIGTGVNGLEKLDVNGGLKLGNSTGTNAGTLRWTGTDFEGYDGSGWVSLTSTGGTTIIGSTSSSFVSSVVNLAGTSTATATGFLAFTTATAVSNAAGAQTFVAPQAGSFASCLVIGNANRTAGSATLRWRVNGASVGSGACVIDGTNPRTSSTSLAPGTVTFSAGDTITVAFDSNGLTPAASTEYTVYWSVNYDQTAGSSIYFTQGGNTFGATAVIGTTDNYGFNLVTNGSTRLTVSNTGAATFNSSLAVASGGINVSGGATVAGGLSVTSGGVSITGNSTISGTLSGITGLTFTSGNLDLNGGSISNVGPNISASAGLSITSGGSGDLSLSSASGLIDLNGNIWRRVAAGTTTVQLNDASDTTLSITNNGTGVANLSVQGTVTASGFSGSGSGLTSLNANNITTGTLSDSQLSTNVALLNTIQTFTARQNFSSGLIVGNTAFATAGALRWTGTDFEGYDGTQWLSLTSGTGGSGALTVAAIQAYDSAGGTDLNTSTPTALPWDSESKKDTGFTHSNVTNNTRVYLDAAGWYKISYNISGLNQTANRNTVFCQVRLNGTTYNSPSGSYSYSRNTTDAGTTNTATVYIQTAGANEYYEVLCSQSGSAGGDLAEANRSWTIAEMTAAPAGGGAQTFNQGANTFGATAILGTGDGYGLNFVTNGSARLRFTATGQAEFTNDVTFDTNTITDGSTTLNGNVTIGDNIADGLTIVSGSVALSNGLNFDSNTFVIDSSGNKVGIGSASPTNKLTINDPSTADSATQVSIFTNGNTNKGLVIQGTSSQSGNLFEAQDSSGNALSYITNSGGFVLGKSTFSSGSLVFNNSSNAYTSTFAPGALSSDSVITLPDSSGVVCLDSNNCSYLKFAASSAQTDSTNNKTIYVNKTSATGDLISFQRSGTDVFKVLNSGAVMVQLNSTTAFNVLNSSGTTLFNVDTSGNVVNVGSLTADGTGVVFVLDTKNSSGDPTGINGGMYYNSSVNKFRCFEASEWKNCIGSVSVRSFIDSTSDAVVDNNTTNYWDTAAENNNSYPNITLSQASGRSVYGTVTMEVTSTSNTDLEVSGRIERGIGSVPTCNSGTQVGAQPGIFSSNTGGQKASTVTFMDSPNTTSTVYYVLCADTATVNTAGNISRIRFTLQEVSNSN